MDRTLMVNNTPSPRQLRREEDRSLKEESQPLKENNSCQKGREKNIYSRLMKMSNFTVFVVLVALICIMGEAFAHNPRNHNSDLQTDPDDLTILRGERASVTYNFVKNLTYDFSVTLNTSKQYLSIDPVKLNFSPIQLSNKINVTGIAVTSRVYIDIQECTTSVGSPCPFSTSNVFVSTAVIHSYFLKFLVVLTGWIYFFAWSISFYPQIVLNFRRRSVEGLNFDFLVLNIIGFSAYSIYNCMLFFDNEVQNLYIDDHPRGQIPVLANDVVFALHALFACIVTGVQCFFCERGNQKISYICMGWSSILMLFAGGSFLATIIKKLNWLQFVYLLSYVKMAVTLSKYLPQAILNFRRKSTVGWSIGNVLLDFTGGTMDIVQMIIQASNTDDWTPFYGNPVKFGLGLVSMVFDVLFMVQHYFLYPYSEAYEIRHEENNSTETIIQGDETHNQEEQEPDAAAFDSGLYH